MMNKEVLQSYRTLCIQKNVKALNIIIEDLKADYVKNLQVPSTAEDLIRVNGGYAALCQLQAKINRDPQVWADEAAKQDKVISNADSVPKTAAKTRRPAFKS